MLSASFCLKLHTYRDANPERQNGGKELRHGIETPVEYLNRAGGYFFWLALSHPSAPQDIVGDEQAAPAQARQYQIEHARIILLIDVVEHDVELLLLLRQAVERPAHFHMNALFDAGPLEVSPGFGGVLFVAVGIEDFPALAHGLGPPDGGITDGRAHLENPLSFDKARILKEHAGHSRTDDGHIPFFCLVFNLPPDGA